MISEIKSFPDIAKVSGDEAVQFAGHRCSNCGCDNWEDREGETCVRCGQGTYVAPTTFKLLPLDDSPDGDSHEDMLIMYALYIANLDPQKLLDAIKIHGTEFGLKLPPVRRKLFSFLRG
jgi:ribosomal protein S27AE